MESSGRAVFKTVPGFACRATFEGDIEGFRLLKVLLATTVSEMKNGWHMNSAYIIEINLRSAKQSVV